MLTRAFIRQFRTCICARNDNKSPSSSSSSSSPSSPVKKLLDDSATFEDINPQSTEDTWLTLPYADGTAILNSRRDQGSKSRRPKIDPHDTSIILFPGQGSQYVGMGKDLLKFPVAKDIFQLANEILQYDLLKLCLKGPKSKLDQTLYAQPAIMATSLAALEQLKEERPNAIDNCIATAGFSLGEITALVFAGAIPFDKGMRLVQIRAEAMQLASEQHKGGMATVIYGPDSQLKLACTKAKEWCLETGIENPECQIANYLYPHCKVVAGNLEAIDFLEKHLKEFKLRRIKRLPVSGAFHTNHMESAVEPFRRALKKITIEQPMISVHSNIDGKLYRHPTQILKQLPKQICRPVKWEQTLHILYEREQGTHFPRTFECGPGKGLTTILKQVNAKAYDSAINIVA